MGSHFFKGSRQAVELKKKKKLLLKGRGEFFLGVEGKGTEAKSWTLVTI